MSFKGGCCYYFEEVKHHIFYPETSKNGATLPQRALPNERVDKLVLECAIEVVHLSATKPYNRDGSLIISAVTCH